MFATIFSFIKMAFIGFLVVTVLAETIEPSESCQMEMVVPPEPWVVRRHQAIRSGETPPPSTYQKPIFNKDGWYSGPQILDSSGGLYLL